MTVEPVRQNNMAATRGVNILSSQLRGQVLPILSIGTAAFSLLYFTRAAEQTRDSLVYAYSAKTGAELFHPHHLLYTPAIRLVLQTLARFCSSCDAILAGQIHNILWSVVGVVAFYFLLKYVWNAAVALPATLLLLVLRGYWELATQTTMYNPSAAILSLTAASLLIHHGIAYSRARTLLLAALLAAAVLYHQSNVLFSLPLGYYLIASLGLKGWKTWLAILALTGGAVLAIYILVYLSVQGTWSLANFIHFCLAYTSEICLGGQCKASPEDWGSLVNLSPSGITLLLQSLLWNYVITPEEVEWIILPLFSLALVALAIWHLIQIIRRADYSGIRGFSLVWIFTYTAFFFWWLPSYQHPFVITLAPTLLLVLLALRDAVVWLKGSQPITYAATGLVLCTALLIGARNYQARILPLHLSPGDSFREAAELNALAPQDCLIFTSYRTWNNLRYYFNRENAIQAKHPMSYFYSEEPLPEQYHMPEESCVFISTTFLSPHFNHDDFASGGMDGYRAPSLWLAYISWLFDFEYDRQEVAASREFTLIRLAEGETYLELLPVKRPAYGLEDLFRRLDDELEEPDRPFGSWLDETYSTLES